MKSIVPAIRVFRPSVEIRVISRIPDSPAVSFRQLSSRPAPSELITPMPVTTTIGRPPWSVFAIANPSIHRFDQSKTLAAPVADAGHHHLPQRRRHRPLESRLVGRWKQLPMAQGHCGKRDISRKLRLKPMTEMGAGGAHGKISVLCEEGAFLCCYRLHASRAGEDGGVLGLHPIRNA